MTEKLTSASVVEADSGYGELERIIAARVAGASGPLFATDADGLFELYLAMLPEANRQHYNCNACRTFIHRYGGLVRIADDGEQTPLLWDVEAPPQFFAQALDRLRAAVLRSRVTGVFLSGDAAWGANQSRNGWTHLGGIPPSVFRHALKTAAQMMAEKHEDYGILRRGLAEFPKEAVAQAVRVLEADALDRSEKTLGVAKWLLELHTRIEPLHGRQKDNVCWLAVARAPAGWCHVRSTMINTLLEDIVAGLPFDEIQRRWAVKMHPLQYQRPTALKEGHIEAANRLVEQLGAASALKRRFARLHEVTHFWWPQPPWAAEKPKSGVFDHLLPTKGGIQEVELPPALFTWERFRREVLLGALEIDLQVPFDRAAFYGLVTAADPAAAAILQWDGLLGQPRNPVSWYLYHAGSYAQMWSLTAGAWVSVKALAWKPCHWQEPAKFQHQGEAVLFVLEVARAMSHQQGGGLFPECLKSEYHEIRAAVEAHANAATIEGKEEGDANGLMLQKGQQANYLLRVRSATGTATYRIDRWE